MPKVSGFAAALVVGSACLLGVSPAEAAKCSQKDYAGTWAMRMTVPQLCIFSLNTKGMITESQCTFAELTETRGEISGKIEVSTSCAVTGKFTQTHEGEKMEWSLKGKGGTSETGLKFSGKAKGGGKSVTVNAYKQY